MRRRLVPTLIAVAAVAVLLPASASAFRYLSMFGEPGHALGQFDTPWSIAVSPAPDNRVFVLDSHNFRVQRFNLDGTAPFAFPSTIMGQGDGQLYYPQGIAFANGLVYVADSANSRIQVFTADGAFVRNWGTEGVGNDQLNHPAGVAVDPQPGGLVYVTDSRNHRVQVFTPEGQYARTIGEPGDADGHFTVPSGIAVADGHVYVSDEQLPKIQVFSLSGQFESKADAPKFVDQLAIDRASNTLWAAAPLFPGQLLKFEIGGGRIGMRSLEDDVYTADKVHSPPWNAHGVAVDSEHRVYMADTEGGRVIVLGECDKAPERGGTLSAGAHVSAVNEVRVVAVQPGVAFHKAGTPEDDWCTAQKDDVLQQGDEVSCDPDGAITLQFADNSTVVVKNTTQLKIASFFTEGGVVRTEILLKMGEVAAQVNKSEATKSDFRIKPPTATASTRGTTFSVFYDPLGKGMIESTTDGSVLVDPTKPGLKSVLVKAGKEVEVTSKSISKVARIGKAGARGGVNRKKAGDRVLALIAKANGPCGISTPRENALGVKPVKGGWAVTVKIVGKLSGSSKWVVKRGKPKPANALAKRLARGCT